ncbi:hypothetical protein GCM10011591_39820 [Nocardia camponoti]|uniref:Uncharacterized protein n=1 Tax=Nocardia camponoti TaxID=1616106 RepID=A0A917VCA9_9NOCA|nr:hypothetical protein GCM10011591_39820 [Nocardia camponoti]
MPAFITRNNLIPAAVAVLNVGLYAYGFVDTVQRGDWLAAAGNGTALCVLYFPFRWWRRAPGVVVVTGISNSAHRFRRSTDPTHQQRPLHRLEHPHPTVDRCHRAYPAVG